MSKVAEHFFPELYGEDEREFFPGPFEQQEEDERAELASAGEAKLKIEQFDDPEFRRSVQIDNYWIAFGSFLDAVGDYSWTVKLERNANKRGIYPAQVVKYDYYNGHRDGAAAVEMNFQIAKQARRKAVWASAYGLNHWSKTVGLPEMSDDEIRGLVNYLIGRLDTENGPDTGRRRKNYFRSNMKRFRERGELRSAQEILERCIALE